MTIDDPRPPHFEEGELPLTHGHVMYWRSHGNPSGPVVLVLHGGPGGHHNPRSAEFFDPSTWRVVMYDQRGCGRSTPPAAIAHNTVAHLVADIERLREHLGITHWALFGGSWGTRLALSYGVAHPRRCDGFMLRGVFLGRPQDVEWFLWDVRRLFPESHAVFLDAVEQACGRRPANLEELLAFTQPVLENEAHPARLALAVAWDQFEFRMASVVEMPAPSNDPVEVAEQARKSLAIAVLERHYMGTELPREPDVLTQVHAIVHLPCLIAHGRYDAICPFEQATQLAAAWPGAVVMPAEQSGHWAFAPQMADLLHRASAALLERMRARDAHAESLATVT
jgi:proline iminopeptidase